MKMDGPSVVASRAARGNESLGSHDERPTTFCHRWKSRTRPTLISTSPGVAVRVPDTSTAIEANHPPPQMSPLAAGRKVRRRRPHLPKERATPLRARRRLQDGHGTGGIARYRMVGERTSPLQVDVARQAAAVSTVGLGRREGDHGRRPCLMRAGPTEFGGATSVEPILLHLHPL